MKIAVLVPCYNEGLTIRKVVQDFKQSLPEADIYVYDNNSKDNTIEEALEAGAIVRREYRQGKGNVVRTMFRDIEADIYILVDGDDTYPAEDASALIQPIIEGKADMVIGDRLSNGRYAQENKRNFHNFGNRLVLTLINKIFNSKINDIMTGYRAYNRYFVKNFPIQSTGFQLETEMSIFALVHNFKLKEVQIEYRDRPEGSVSKLNTVQDGIRVLRMIFDLFKNTRPLLFFSLVAGFLLLLSLILGTPVLYEYFTTQFITHVPLAILASSLAVIASIFVIVGLILDTLAYYHRKDFETGLNHYLTEHKNPFISEVNEVEHV